MYDFGDFSNYIKVAVDRVGGPTKAAHKIGVSNAMVPPLLSACPL